jgi:hypothetical protein
MLVSVGNPPVDGDDYDAAKAAYGSAWHRLIAAVRASRAPQEQFDRATDAGEELAKQVSEIAAERSAAAVRIQDTEGLSLTDLGERIRMTKQAAGRLTNRERRKEP